MRLITALFAATLFALGSLSAEGAVQVGFKGGLNWSNQNVEVEDLDVDDIQRSTGFHLGPTIDLNIRSLAVELGTLLSNKGGKFTFKGIEGMGDVKDRTIDRDLWYVDIPLTFKLNYSLGPLDFYGGLGPYVGIGLTGETLTMDFDEDGEMVEDGEHTEDIDWGEHLKRDEYGLELAAGGAVGSFRLGATYRMGLSGIEVDNGTDLAPDKIDNRVLGAYVGFWF